MKKKLQNAHLAKKVGKTSYIQVLWKDWKKERPPKGEKVFVIVRLTNGYFPVFGEYLEWTSEKTMSKKEQPPITFRFVRFDSISMPEIYLGSKDEKRLIAWGAMEDYKPHE
jgi:hypothetical protein